MITYSFIIPHKNSPELLNRCLDSIPARNDVEIIIVDDNSEFCKRPHIKRINTEVIFLPKEDSFGAGHARNVGMMNAHGKWLLFADCDDYYEDGFLTKLDAFKDQDIDILYFLFYHFSPSKEQLNTISFEKYMKSNKTTADKNHFVLSSTMPWNKMFNHEFIKSIKVTFEEIPVSNDAWFVLYSGAKAERISLLFEKLYHYIDNSKGITKSKHPIEHYYLAMKSNIRRNELKYNSGCWDLISLPGFNWRRIKKDYGLVELCKAFIYKFYHDSTIIKVILKRILFYLLSLCIV